MDLSTSYMGIGIRNPIIASSSNLTSDIESIKALADQGIGAVVLKSLFEEQIISDKTILDRQDEMYYWYPEAVNFLDTYISKEGITEYLKLIEQAKKTVSIPVFASINCNSPQKWPSIASEIENSGADGLELNIMIMPADINVTASQIEDTFSNIILEVRKNIKLPISIKISSYFTNLHRMLYQLCKKDINSLVLFNRAFRPDIDINNIRVVSDNIFSAPEEITLSLRWIAMLQKRVNVELVAATGIHDGAGVIKQVLAGATAVQVCSTLYKNGIGYIATMLEDIRKWMQDKGYESLAAFRGLVGENELNAASYERVQFMKKTAGKIF